MIQPSNDPLILAIETSCDETAAAVVRGRSICSNIVASQIDTHSLYGGVVPEIASRMHAEAISSVVGSALREANVKLSNLDAVAVTNGPGLVGALLVGVSYAKGLAYASGKPLLAVNHMRAHIAANYIENDFEPPFLCLVVSGGHTELVMVREDDQYEWIGGSMDDAAGEAFDKTARVLGLGYPGGRKMDELAEKGNPNAYLFPRALMEEGNYNFSFSGMKTSVYTQVQKHGAENMADLCASVRAAIVDVLVTKTVSAARELGITRLALAGGVAANKGLRDALGKECAIRGWSLYMPPLPYCTDNAAMVGAAALSLYAKQKFAPLSLNAIPSLELSQG